MVSDALPRHGLSFLPKIFGHPQIDTATVRFGWRYSALLAAFLVPPFALALYLGLVAFPGRTWPEHIAHMLVEGFCAMNSLILFYVLYQQYIPSGNRRLQLMSLGFMAMGILDFFHLLQAPGSNLFVWFRSTAALAAPVFLFVSVWAKPQVDRSAMASARRSWKDAGIFGLAVVLFGLLCNQFEAWLPAMSSETGFAPTSIALNTAAAVLYGATGVSLLREFRRSGEWILLVFAIGMFLFAESQAMFPFSKLWDASWWAWHGIRTGIFIGIVLGLAHEFVQSARELEMSHAAVVEAEKLASLGEMAAAMAHELRNPLGTLTNSLGLLRDGHLSASENAEVLTILEQEVNRLNHIASDTLSFARPRHRQLEPVALEPLVRRTLDRFQPSPNNLELAYVFDPNLPLVLGSPDQLQQVIWNLADNAFAAMDRQGRLVIRAHRDMDAVVLCIEDSGPGIPDAIRDQVLRPFFSTKPNGTGLGLPIVKRILEDHGGSLRIESRVGEGTCVMVRLPVCAAPGLPAANLAIDSR